MPELIVVTGAPGLGKSSVAALVCDGFEPAALVEGDAFFAFLRRGAVDPWLPASQEQNTAVIEAAAAASGRLAKHCTVVYAGVLGPWFTDAFLAAAGLERVHYAVLSAPLATCLARVAGRVGHGFTDPEAATAMWRQFEASPIPARHRVDATAPAPEVAAAILHGVAQGSLLLPRRV